jgi:hypothetical protein
MGACCSKPDSEITFDTARNIKKEEAKIMTDYSPKKSIKLEIVRDDKENERLRLEMELELE